MDNENGCIHVRLILQLFERSDGIPLGNLEVQLLDPDEDDKVVATVTTGDDGLACFEDLQEDKTYSVLVPELINEDADRYPEVKLIGIYERSQSFREGILTTDRPSGRIEDVVAKAGDCASPDSGTQIVAVYEVLAPSVMLDALGEVREISTAVRSLVDFSPTTSPSPVIGRGSLRGVRQAGPIGDVFANFVGASRATNDLNTVIRALERSFEETEKGKYTYNPRARVFEPRVGAIRLTGNQARLYERAKIFYDDALKRITMLEPATEGVDEERVTALKAIIRNLLEGLITEFGRDDEPREVLVNASFEALLGSETTEGVVEQLGDALEYEVDEFIDVEDEEQQTHLQVLDADVRSIKAEWDSWRLGTTGGLNLGSNLRELSQSLKQASQAVQFIRSHLIALGTGLAGETFIDKDSDLTLDDVVDLVDQSVNVQWPNLIVEGRRQGAIAILPLARGLSKLVRDVAKSTTGPYDRPGLRPALNDLADALDEVVSYAEKLASGNGQPVPAVSRE